MKISLDNNTNSPSYKGILNNKTFLNGLETISEHSASFTAATSCVMASGVRPLAIYAIPNVKKENKEYAIANSISSGVAKFAMFEIVAFPIENAIKKTERNPKKFLKPQTYKNFLNNTDTLDKSRNFKFITQLIKQSIGFFTAIPKSIITAAFIPILMDKIFSFNIQQQHKEKQSQPFSSSFKGGMTDNIANGIGKILDLKFIQNIAKKFSSKDADITRNMSVSTDILLTSSFTHQTLKSEKIDENCKKPLILNNVYGTIASILFGCTIDSAVKKNTKHFIDKFKKANNNNPKIHKYIEGINIVRPTLIFAFIYYGIIPMFTTYLADKTDKKLHFSKNF